MNGQPKHIEANHFLYLLLIDFLSLDMFLDHKVYNCNTEGMYAHSALYCRSMVFIFMDYVLFLDVCFPHRMLKLLSATEVI